MMPTDDWSLSVARSQRAEPLQLMPSAEMIGSTDGRKIRAALMLLDSILAPLSIMLILQGQCKRFLEK